MKNAGKTFEEAFKKMEKQGKNTVDNVMKWVKDSNLLKDCKEEEARARRLFDEAAEQSRVGLDKFKGVVSKLAEKQKKTLDSHLAKLSEEGPKFLEGIGAAIKSGASAAKEAYKDTRNKQNKK